MLSTVDKDKLNKEKKQTKKANSKVNFWASECKYSVILDLVSEIGWRLIDDERLASKVNLFWIDVATIHEHFRTIQPWQSINHFPGMPNIARKNRMGQNLNRMQKIYPKEYSFYPRTWVLPGEMADFRQQFDGSGNALNNKIFIIKPDAGCQGRGIFLTKSIENVPFNENVVAQVYIKKPLLIDGFKFDLRLYCIITSVKPLRMYLFHDGLVRMCTEEYVKPTKENIHNSCMHLTNYAVNKRNENFLQPSAQSSEENQDSGSKRSLLWFMNWIRKEHGDKKAEWLWKRFGTLCTRTVLSILPTLSREYDQHFKSFSNIPIDLKNIQTYLNSTNPTIPSNSSIAKPPGGVKPKPNYLTRNNRNTKESGSEESGSEEDNNTNNNEEQDETNNEEQDERSQYHMPHPSSDKNSQTQEDESLFPKIRGSRCFEILGFDIMIDNNLNPILIELNHLPSFGTDSALDKDIKDRLMRQVFSVLAVMPDDQQAYNLFHKAEAEKRYAAQKAAREKELLAMKEKPKPAPRPRRDSSLPSANIDKQENKELTNETSENTNENQENNNENTSEQTQINEINSNNTQPTEDLGTIDEECTPERLEVIKKILLDIYEKKSPEKINKIDRLLSKYLGHEEEFLQFVFAKYNVSEAEYPTAVRKPAEKQSTADNSDNNSINPPENNNQTEKNKSNNGKTNNILVS